MIMFKISSNLSPLRLIEGQKTPAIITIYVKNESEETKMVSLLLKIPFSLGFDKMGLEREKRRRIGTIKPGTEKAIPIMIYPKSTIKEGVYKINTRVKIHEDRYDKTEKEFNLETDLRVVGR